MAKCDPEIYRKGRGLCVIDAWSRPAERWVRLVAKKSGARIDWHYSGGRANVLHLGDEASYRRALNAIEELKGKLRGRLLSVGGPALYRLGVDPPFPKGTIGFY